MVAKYVAIRCHAFLYVHICISSHNADRRIVCIMAAYSGYQKNGKHLSALQAVGFGVEQGFKESVKVGFGMVEQRHVSTFLLSGDVRVKIGGTFVQTTTPQSITLRAEDAVLAFSVYKEELTVLEELGLNVWAVDKKIPSLDGSHDLVACFIQPDRPVNGLVSIELKTMRLDAGPAVLRKKQTAVQQRFAQMQELRSQAAYHAIVLLVCKVGKVASNWGQPCADAYLWDGTAWATLTRRPRPSVFAKLRRKKRSDAILRSFKWYPMDDGPRVATVAEFLRKLNMDDHNVGQRVKLWNRELSAGLQIHQVKWAAGEAPWCGTRLAFARILRQIHA